jgi:hypothetical protein
MERKENVETKGLYFRLSSKTKSPKRLDVDRKIKNGSFRHNLGIKSKFLLS